MRPFISTSLIALVALLSLVVGVSIGQCDDLKRTWIYGSPESVRKAAENRNLNIPDSGGMTPLHHAAQHNSGEAVFILLSLKAEVNARTSLERTPLMLAAMDNENKDAILPLVAFEADRDAKDILGKTALILATEKGNQWAVSDLLRYGANPFLKDNNGKTALDYAKNNTALVSSEARRQLVLYSDPAKNLYQPDSAPPQKTALPWRGKAEPSNTPEAKPQGQNSGVGATSAEVINAIVENVETAKAEPSQGEPAPPPPQRDAPKPPHEEPPQKGNVPETSPSQTAEQAPDNGPKVSQAQIASNSLWSSLFEHLKELLGLGVVILGFLTAYYKYKTRKDS